MTDQQNIFEIERLEDLRYTAMLSQDVEALDVLLHNRLLHVHSTGNQHTKGAYLNGLKNREWVYQQIDRFDQNIVLQSDTALVFNHLLLRLELKGQRMQLHNQALSVWIREKGAWQLIAMHSGLEPSEPR
ncbi:nuclear transport factor 2 family protein [Terriglobus aquaticus]|nr:nuclear transport factor 2 family protein [Terriglobus aquaticus]